MENDIRILILDDEKDIAYFTKEYLLRRDYIVESALNYKRASRLIDTFKPNIAIIDICLGSKPDGIDFLIEVKNKLPHCKCIMMTCDDQKETIKKAQELNADDYLIKPISIQQLEQSIKKAIKKRRG